MLSHRTFSPLAWIKVLSLTTTLILLLSSTSSYAIFDIQGMVGQRKGTWEKNDGSDSTSTNAEEFRLGVHLDPIPLVPIAFGLGIELDTFKDPEKLGFADGLTGTSVQPEILAWLPLGDFKPYVRLGYALNRMTGKATATVADASFDYTVEMGGTGIHFGIGIRYSLIPSLALLAEYSMGSEDVEVVSATLNGQDIKSSIPNVTYKSQAMLLGAEWGL